MKLEEIAKNVYACLQVDKGLGWSNSGFINSDGGLVIDTFWDLPHTRQLIEQYARVWHKPVQRLLNTHHNGDHCWGNQLFTEAEIIGHRQCAANINKENPERLQSLKDASRINGDPYLVDLAEALSEWDFSDIQPTPPTTLIDERLELNLDGILTHLIYVGPAHTSGDVIAHLPEQKIVFTGDILFRLCTPIGWDGTYDGWIAALEYIVSLQPDVVVPGHGPLCDVNGVKEMKNYLVYVRQEARQCFDRGLSIQEAAKQIDLGVYASWTEPERILFSLDRAYREFRGEPFDAPIDSTTLFRGMFELRRDTHFCRA